jgi:hypothetical protein
MASRALGIVLLGWLLAAPGPAGADGFPVANGRYAGGPATILELDAGQRASIDQARQLVLTASQQDRLFREAGTRASEFLVYDLRLAESDCTCNAANVAFRFSEDQVEVAHLYLMTDDEAARRRAEFEGESRGAARRAA